LQMVLCQLRNTQVTEIEASGKGFDDDDAARIANALRCVWLCRNCICLKIGDF
jgi:hypothetical protein